MVVYAFEEGYDYYNSVVKNLGVVIFPSGLINTIKLLLMFVNLGSCFLILLVELSLFP